MQGFEGHLSKPYVYSGTHVFFAPHSSSDYYNRRGSARRAAATVGSNMLHVELRMVHEGTNCPKSAPARLGLAATCGPTDWWRVPRWFIRCPTSPLAWGSPLKQPRHRHLCFIRTTRLWAGPGRDSHGCTNHWTPTNFHPAQSTGDRQGVCSKIRHSCFWCGASQRFWCHMLSAVCT